MEAMIIVASPRLNGLHASSLLASRLTLSAGLEALNSCVRWQATWRQRLGRCYDSRDALMCAATLEVRSCSCC